MNGSVRVPASQVARVVAELAEARARALGALSDAREAAAEKDPPAWLQRRLARLQDAADLAAAVREAYPSVAVMERERYS